MNSIFHDEVDECVVAYLDDIFVFSKNEEDHARDLAKIMDKLKQHKLLANEKKSEFFLNELNFLGHVLEGKGNRSDPSKIQAIKEWKAPKS